MLGCSTVCPNCQHQFACCPPSSCANVRRSLHALSGGGLVATVTPPQFGNLYTSPQISPSVPLSFVIPPIVIHQHHQQPKEVKTETEVKTLSENLASLRKCGWFYENITYQQSDDLLKNKPVGTFLVRESSDPSFLYSLSVQTERGPTSVRIHFVNGYFRLDAQSQIQSILPLFTRVISLVQHYVSHCRKNDAQVFVDANGKLYSPITLEKPLYKDITSMSLKHLSRLACNKLMYNTSVKGKITSKFILENLEIPQNLSIYLPDYPYWL